MAINPIRLMIRLALMTTLGGLPSGGVLAEDPPPADAPAENATSAPITGSRDLLRRLGMDVGLLDDLVDRKGLTGADREAFYQMLAAMAQAEPGTLRREAKRRLPTVAAELKRTDKEGNEYYSVVPLFNQPASQRGRLVALRGTARRVVRIGVGDEDIRERFGIDHYYTIYLFPEDAQHNPVVFGVRELPPGMPTGDGPEYGEYCEVAGFFFKSWAYRAPSAARGPDAPGGVHRVQFAPLLIGRQPVWFPRQPPARNALFGAIAGGLFVVVLLGIWLALWASSRADRRFYDRTLAKRFRKDEQNDQ